jgi:hypothetical protein
MAVMNEIWRDLSGKFNAEALKELSPGDAARVRDMLSRRDFGLLAETDWRGRSYLQDLVAAFPRPTGPALVIKGFIAKISSSYFHRDIAKCREKANLKLETLLADPAARPHLVASLRQSGNMGTPVHDLIRCCRPEPVSLLLEHPDTRAAVADGLLVKDSRENATPFYSLYIALGAPVTQPDPVMSLYELAEGFEKIVDRLEAWPETKAAMVKALMRPGPDGKVLTTKLPPYQPTPSLNDFGYGTKGRQIFRDRLRRVIDAAFPDPGTRP